jgi:hypothetical protein
MNKERPSRLQQYNPPVWAKDILHPPPTYVQVTNKFFLSLSLNGWLFHQLAIRNTPIHAWRLPGIPEGFKVFLKRDDMTGSVLGGNKVVVAIIM